MKTKRFGVLVLSAGLALCGAAGQAQMAGQTDMTGAAGMERQMAMKGHDHDRHGPVGLTGTHVVPRGKFMLTYRYGHMDMSGLRLGTTDVSADYVAANVPNRYFGMPGQPPTLRVIPEEMTMDMHMFGAMYGLNERVTLMAMLPYIEKDMTAITYQGPVGTTVLGRSSRHSEGLGDVKLGALYQLMKQGRTTLTGGLGLSLPTGSITETGQMLTPMGMQPVGRLAYPMQLGSGTFDLLPSLSWQTGSGPVNWGAQLRGAIRLGTNDEGYSLGDEAVVNLWASYRAAPWLSLSGRIEAQSIGRIDGADPAIMGPAPGADPLNAGGDFVTLYASADLTPKRGALKGHKLGVELGVPIHQDLNGPMTKRDWSVTLAWRTMF